ncbi:Alpha/beta hydrolase family protein [Pseudodesulfovibrio hydrargyri]|uniref:Alpha/beta hydrolase family protein n=1 Tax=Pseudodesulfovibrio hydrargyri TaxID=2125990 RepID=A0A1J5N9R3_9BACT|nr:alpha/beta fold hydrolase [Pseudodesulfovibrio hydrargyri]OIQ52371.1 Alpha/beta hydrolase family protein [Pseudodesulfovibrio hydrargyri]
MAVFVLLHDAFQGGWVWRQTARELRDLGHEVHTPSYAGRTLPLDTDSADSPARAALENLVRYFKTEDITGAAIVCSGWSGLLGPALAAALPSAVRTLVFWDAVVPEPGKSFMEVCPASLAEAIDGNSESAQVAPFVSGPLTWLELCEDSASLLAPFPRRAFTEPYTGPARGRWPKSLFVHSPDEDGPGSPFVREAVEGTGMPWLELNMYEYPLLGRAQELALLLADQAASGPSRSQDGCARNTMPHELRMQYCSHYRKRHEMAVACEGIDA